jgi:acetyl esterase/lipase
MRPESLICAAAIALLWPTSACDHHAPQQTEERSYLDRLASFHTKLLRHGPAPQAYQDEALPSGIQEILYPSGSLRLRAWAMFPKGASPAQKVPGVVYLHGGFAFGVDDLVDALPFLKAGYAVLIPSLRGENGNPGVHELYLGEVDDAKAAIRWLAAQPSVDASRLYTFGHSAGGIVSALLSLHEDVPIRYGGSAGGLYGTSLFDANPERIPFDSRNPEERRMRVLIGNVRWMRRAHYAYVGAEDRWQQVTEGRREAASPPRLLTITVEPGNHLTSLAPSIEAFLRVLHETP